MSDHLAALLADEDARDELLALLAPRIADALAPELARVVAELQDVDEWVGPAETARHFNLNVSWVYRHKHELGGLRTGDGPKARWRFNPKIVAERLSARSGGSRSDGPDTPAPVAKPRRAHPRRGAGDREVPLLAIRGQVE